MAENKYLKWLAHETQSNWWHDSAIPEELDEAISNGAVGLTTNPFLVRTSLFAMPGFWKPMLKDIPKSINPAQKAEEIAKVITVYLAKKLLPIYERTQGEQGYACAQVNPGKAGDADIMLDMARRLTKWSPNIAVKLPVTQAGLEVLEECVAEGLTVTATASFTVPQALAIGDRHMKGLARAKKNNIKQGKCFAVIMVGRLDDYIRDVAHDRKASNVRESDIIQAGIAAIMRSYDIYHERKYEAILMPAGKRGAYHIKSLSGAKMVMSIAPKIAKMVMDEKGPYKEHMHEPVAKDVIARLMTIPEFVRGYEPDGMRPEEFITYGVMQKTLAQFVEAGWGPMEGFDL